MGGFVNGWASTEQSGLDRVEFDPLGRPMAADQYRRRAFEARQRAEQASDSSVKAGWERVAHEWLALADQVELFDRRYGKFDSAEAIPERSEIVQQQQQVQPQKDDDKQK